jgi:uncharacterized protein
MIVWLAPLFALVALIYASVGFAGGSTYTALLVLAGVSLPLVPLVSLGCNIVVASGGVAHFQRAGHIAWRRAAPLLLVSVPLAWIGGSLPVAPELFVPLLGWSLVSAGLLLMLGPDRQATRAPVDARAGPGLVPLLLAAPLGLLSGVVGIGGGIFLAPLLHLMGWDSARRIAGTAAVFILANSLAGLAGQAAKLGDAALLDDALGYWPLVIAVLVGGQLGSLLGAQKLPLPLIRRVTGLVVLVAAIRLLTA